MSEDVDYKYNNLTIPSRPSNPWGKLPINRRKP
jgi:hypothetical protein